MGKYPYLIQGGQHIDQRGQLCYNNNFSLYGVKRIYTIENWGRNTVRGWQGHKIERRWFSAVNGSFRIELIEVDNWEEPSKNSGLLSFDLLDKKLDILYIPRGYVTKIQSLKPSAKLLVMADYSMGEVEDEYRYALNYFDA